MKKLFKKELSVIVPSYNEQENIEALLQRISKTFTKHKVRYEIIVIDDHSKDDTVKIAKKLSKKYHVKSFLKSGKQGKAYSLIEGFQKSKYENIAFIDADLQYPPEDLVPMLEKLKFADVIASNRKKYNDRLLRKFLSRSFRYFFGKLFFGLDHDIQAGLKVFKREVISTIPLHPKSSWTFDLEFLHNAREAGFTIINHDIEFQKRKKGESKIGILKTSYEIGVSALKLRFSLIPPRHTSPISAKSMKGAGIRYKRKQYVTHTTLGWQHSSIRTFSRTQRAVFIIGLLIFAATVLINPLIALSALVMFLSFIYFADTVFNLFVVLKSLYIPQEISIGNLALSRLDEKSLPIYTILCPLYKESHIIPQFVKNISQLSWPQSKLDVILLLEEDDKESIIATKKMNLPSFVQVVVVPNSQPKTKPKACNYGLSYAKGDYLVIYDAEDKPDPMQLKKAYLSFKKARKDIVCLQAKLNYYNPSQNLLTRFFTTEYSLWFDVTLTGFQSINTSIPLGGTSNHFRVKDIYDLQGWDPFNVTEDADLGMRLFKKGFKTAIIDSVTLEEANSKWGNWLRQRSRWIKGYMQTYLVHTRNSLSFARQHGRHFPLFHLIIGGKIAFILINPFLWIATVAYFTLHAYVGELIERLYPSIVFYAAAFSLIFGNFLFMYYYMVGAMKREQYGLIKYTFLIPFYWLMISIAGFMALYQLIFKPFYWEKTVHGLHLLQKKKKAKKVLMPQPIPRVGFGYISISNGIHGTLNVYKSTQKGILDGFAVILIFIGEVEKNALSILLKGVKKGIVLPLKYAASMMS